MRFALMIEPQMGLTYAQQLDVVLRAEAAGYEAFFRSDHYEGFPGDSDTPTTDAWAVLAGLARDTQRIGLGALVSPVGFRSPGNLAKLALTVDEMSAGRVEVGLGAGWHEHEHRRHGFPFGEIGERADMLEETLEIVRGLWEGPDGWSFLGSHWAVEDSLFRPKAADVRGREAGSPGARPNLIVGGQGTPRSYRIAARYADEFNLSSASPAQVVQKFSALDAAVREAGRDPATLVHSAMIGLLIGHDEAEVRRREEDLVRAFGGDVEGFAEWFEVRKARWIHGTPDQAREQARRFRDAGVARIVFQDFLAHDLDMIDLAAEVLFDI